MPPKAESDDLRRYTRQHLYSALKLTATVVDKRDGHQSLHTATGFALHVMTSDAQRRTLLVTNRHVLDPAYSGSAENATRFVEALQVQGVSVSRGQNKPFELVIQRPRPILPKNYDIDVGAIDVTEMDLPGGLHGVAFSSVDLVPEFDALTDVVGVGSEIVMAGYPKLGEGVGDRPILVPGLVASDLLYDAEYGGNVYPMRGLCHAFSRGGMSGSPVLTTVMWDRGWDGTQLEPKVQLLGINVGHPDELLGPAALSLFVPAWGLASVLVEAGDQFADLMVILAESRRRMEFEDLVPADDDDDDDDQRGIDDC